MPERLREDAGAAAPAPQDPRRAAGRESYRDTLRRLAGAQKPAAFGSPAYSRFVNRRIGRYLAAGAFQLGLTPNQVTAVSAVFSLAGILTIALVEPAWWVGLVVALAGVVLWVLALWRA